MASARPSTPPAPPHNDGLSARSPITPEQVRRMEIGRLKAKALREQREAEQSATLKRADSSNAGQKRSFATYAETPATLRDASSKPDRPLEAIQPARNFAKYVEYDFSKMTDTKGGFLTAEDDPHNRALHAKEDEDNSKPANMTMREWERQQLMRSLRNNRAGPFEPGISGIKDDNTKYCRECGILEIDWKWDECFGLSVCNACKDKFPDKYVLLTKTDAREDYLLTDPELKDEALLPHMERPNPHKSTWAPMMMYLRCQVEEYAFSDKKWGSPEGLDAEWERRQIDKKTRRDKKFQTKLADLKKRTRVEAHQRARKNGGRGNFGDDLGDGRHVHEFGTAIDNPETGMPVKTCIGCGLEVEELEL